jgi:hypothetical protein
VLTADEMLDADVAAARDDRRVAEGFVSPADARAFLELARRAGGDERDPITRAYFRELAQPAARTDEPPARDDRELAALLRQAEVIAPEVLRPRAALPAVLDAKPEQTHVVAPSFERAMRDLRERDPETFSARVREVGYLVNVWIAGGAHEGRRPRPDEAMELVLRRCEAGLLAQLGTERPTPPQALAALVQTSADLLFRRGSRGPR